MPKHRARFMMAILAVAASAAAGMAETIGSPLVNRHFTDIDAGQVYIYDGTTAPFAHSGTAQSWSFFDQANTGRSVTPLIFQINQNGSFTVTGIGTTRASTGSGVQSYAFGSIAGSASVVGGDYTFGFTNRAYSNGQSGLVAGDSNDGVINFDRPSATIPADQWLETAGATSPNAVTLQIGSMIGTGGTTIYNPQDTGGPDRVYSSQFTVPEPSALAFIGFFGAAFVACRRHR